MSALHTACTTRLTQLRQDLVTGRGQLQQLQETLLRIEGAVQILEECLAAGAQDAPGATNGVEASAHTTDAARGA
jgi:hypothetical protein